MNNKINANKKARTLSNMGDYSMIDKYLSAKIIPEKVI